LRHEFFGAGDAVGGFGFVLPRDMGGVVEMSGHGASRRSGELHRAREFIPATVPRKPFQL
jgi:hypothetical protein